MRNKQNDELAVCGLSAVKKLEKKDWKKIRRLYFTKETAPFFGGLCQKLAEIAGIRGEKPLLIVLGNEEDGISDDVRKNCDECVIIPFAGFAEGAEPAIQSLNVAQAASIILYELQKNRPPH